MSSRSAWARNTAGSVRNWAESGSGDGSGVRKKGFEPSRPKAPEPKSGASTNSATRAVVLAYLLALAVSDARLAAVLPDASVRWSSPCRGGDGGGGMTWRLLEAAKRPPMPPRTLPRPAGRVVGERGLRQPEPAARPGRARERARYVRAMRPSPGSSTRHELRSAPAPRPRGGRARSCDSASSSCSPCVFTARIWALRGRAECRYLLRPGDGWLMGSRHGAADVTSRHPVVGRSARNRCGPYDRRRGERSR